MKKLLSILFGALVVFTATAIILVSCEEGELPGSSETATASTPAGCVTPKLATTTNAGGQLRAYYLVPGFDPKNKACWQHLREAGKGSPVDGPVVISFLDAKAFTPAADGLYGSDEVRKKVVAQWVLNESAGVDMFSADPFGYGKYTESE